MAESRDLKEKKREKKIFLKKIFKPGESGFDRVCILDDFDQYLGRSRGDNAINTANIAQKNPAKPR